MQTNLPADVCVVRVNDVADVGRLFANANKCVLDADEIAGSRGEEIANAFRDATLYEVR